LKGPNVWIKLIVSLAFVVACAVFISLFLDSAIKIDQQSKVYSSLDSWNIQNSALNGAPLNEEKSIYQFKNNAKITTLYVSVFPTDINGRTVDFSTLNEQTALSDTSLDLLNANVIVGEDEDGRFNDFKNHDVINAAIRVRGASSLSSPFKSYKLTLKNPIDSIYGAKVLNLNKHPYDNTKIANKFCMDMLSTVPTMGSLRTSFVIMYIRDTSLPKNKQKYKYYGLYTYVEQPNRTYLKAHGFDSNGSLYKVNSFEFRMSPELKNVTDPAYNKTSFETILKIREGTDHSKLLNMINDINDLNKDFPTMFKTYFNEDNYLSWVACNILFGNEDTISHNFIMYNPTNSLTWYFLPWDYDGTFRFDQYTSHYDLPMCLNGIQRLSSVMLHRRYFRQPGNIQKLTKKIEELLKTSFSQKNVNNLLNSYKPVLENTMTRPPDLLLTQLQPNQILPYIDEFYNQIVVYYHNYLNSLKFPSPVFVSEPVRRSNGFVDFLWEPSFDFNGNLVSYDLMFAKDPLLKDVVFKAENILESKYSYKKFVPKGLYYMKLTIKDSEGNVQLSLDFTEPAIGDPEFGKREVNLK